MVARALVAAAALIVVALAAPRLGQDDAVTISILGTNDLHGHLVPDGRRGGLEVFAGYVSNLRRARARDHGAVVLVDAGDLLHGTLESNLDEGATVIEVYNALGYAAAAVGNHDFDFGPVGPSATPVSIADDPRGALKARARQASFPLLAANMIDAETGRPVNWPNIRPSTSIHVAGVTVGIVGVVTKSALGQTMALNTRGLRIAPLAGAIAAEASALRRAGARVVIVLAHAGGRCRQFDRPSDLSSCDAASSEILEVSHALPKGLVDVIIAGHTHAGMAHDLGTVSVSEAFAYGRSFSRVDVTVGRSSGPVRERRVFAPRDVCATVARSTTRCDPGVAGRQAVVATYEGEPVVADSTIARTVALALARADEFKRAPLGVVLETPIRRAGGVESPLGNLFVDALRDGVPGADVAINNSSGGLRADLPAGALTYGQLHDAFPFDNEIATLRVSGAELRRVLARALQRGSLQGISGVSVIAQCAAGRMAVDILMPSGRPVDDRETLLVVTTDFLAAGGEGVFTPIMPSGGFDVEEVEPLARDVVADWFRRRGGRLREADVASANAPRWRYPGTLPMTCAR